MRRKQTCSITTPILHKSSLNLKMTYCMFRFFILYCIKTRKRTHFINNSKKSSNSEQTKDKANPNNNHIVQTSWTFCVLFIAYVDYANPFKVSKLSLKVNNLTFMLHKYL